MESDLRRQGYGNLLSKFMMMYAVKYGISNSKAANTKKSEAQKIILQKWENFGPMVPLGQCFLIINGSKLYLIRSTEKVSSNYSGGVSVSTGIPGIFNVSAKIDYGKSYVPEDLTIKSEVPSIYHAEKMISESPIEFPPFDDGRGGKKLTPQGLREHLGAILLVCILLKNA